MNLPRVFVTENIVYLQWPGSLPQVWSKVVSTPGPIVDSVIRPAQGPCVGAVELGPIEINYDDPEEEIRSGR